MGILVDRIWHKMNVKIFILKPGKKITFNFIVLDLKRKMMEDIAFSMKTETHELNATLIQILFKLLTLINVVLN